MSRIRPLRIDGIIILAVKKKIVSDTRCAGAREKRPAYYVDEFNCYRARARQTYPGEGKYIARSLLNDRKLSFFFFFSLPHVT